MENFRVKYSFDADLSDKKYNYFISLGNSCASALCFDLCKLRTQTYAFDWCVSSLNVVYDCLKNSFNNFFDVNKKTYEDMKYIHDAWEGRVYTSQNITNKYFGWYPHYTKKPAQLYETVIRRNNYLLETLKNNDRKYMFLFINDHGVYLKKFREMQDEYYILICKIEKLLIEKYKINNFTILCFWINRNYKNTTHIKNINMEIDNEYLDYRENFIKFYHSVKNYFKTLNFSLKNAQ